MAKTVKDTRVLVNRAKCKLCNTEIESKHRHDYQSCKCGEIFVDGGRDYLRRGAKNFENFIEQSIEEEYFREPYSWEKSE